MVSEKFARWWRRASPDEKSTLVLNSGSSYNALSNVAHGKVVGPELAGRLEDATRGALKRGDLSDICRRCRYYKGER